MHGPDDWMRSVALDPGDNPVYPERVGRSRTPNRISVTARRITGGSIGTSAPRRMQFCARKGRFTSVAVCAALRGVPVLLVRGAAKEEPLHIVHLHTFGNPLFGTAQATRAHEAEEYSDLHPTDTRRQ